MVQRALLLVNLGSPGALTVKSIRVFLADFLMDKRVIDTPRIIWWPILNGIILRKRPPRIIENYKKIWMNDHKEKDGSEVGNKGGISPLCYYTKKLTELIGQFEQIKDKFFSVIYAMNYAGTDDHKGACDPYWSVTAAVKHLCEKVSIEEDELEIYVLPMYPQYSTTTVLPVEDSVKRALQAIASDVNRPCNIVFRMFTDYYRNQKWINAVAGSIKKYMDENTLTFDNTRVLFSYHGVPVRYVKERKDPYAKQCFHTTVLLGNALSLIKGDETTLEKLVNKAVGDKSHKPDFSILPHTIIQSFQSQFGPEKWLTPSTLDTLKQLGAEKDNKYPHLVVVSPGFSADCIETLEELNVEGREEYMEAAEKAGNKDKTFHFVMCLNSTFEHVEAIIDIVEKQEYMSVITHKRGEKPPVINWSY